VERELYTRKAAERAGVDVRSVMAGVTFQAPPPQAPQGVPTALNIVSKLFKWCIEEPSLLEEVDEARLEALDDPLVRQVFRRAVESWQEERALRPELLYEVDLPDSTRDLLVKCFVDEYRDPDEKRKAGFDMAWSRLERDQIRRRIAELEDAVKRLSKANDAAKIRELQKEMMRLQSAARTNPTTKGKVHVQEVN